MHVLHRAFWLPKAGNTVEEYEDACWPQREGEAGSDVFRCAVADGATETSFSGLWARLLVQSFCAGRLRRRTLRKTLPHLQRAWRQRVAAKPLPWYAEEKVRSGAFSSLVGLTIGRPCVGDGPGDDRRSGGEGAWGAIAIGDSCLFQVRNDRLIAAFPLTRSDRFNSRPALLASDPRGNARLAESLAYTSGCWATGDSFYLMTDALACWFLRAVEAGEQPWTALRDLTRGEQGASFAEWVAGLREAARLRNDDVTVLRVELA